MSFTNKYDWLQVKADTQIGTVSPQTVIKFTPDENYSRSARKKDIRLHIGDKYEDFTFTQVGLGPILKKTDPSYDETEIIVAGDSQRISTYINLNTNLPKIRIKVERQFKAAEEFEASTRKYNYTDFIADNSVQSSRIDNEGPTGIILSQYTDSGETELEIAYNYGNETPMWLTLDIQFNMLKLTMGLWEKYIFTFYDPDSELSFTYTLKQSVNI